MRRFIVPEDLGLKPRRLAMIRSQVFLLNTTGILGKRIYQDFADGYFVHIGSDVKGGPRTMSSDVYVTIGESKKNLKYFNIQKNIKIYRIKT